MTLVRPMLGVNVDLCKLKYPVYVSPKLDGVRAVITNDGVYSRSGKLIPNEYTQQLFKQFIGLDGELIVDNPTASDVYRKTVSGSILATAQGRSGFAADQPSDQARQTFRFVEA